MILLWTLLTAAILASGRAQCFCKRWCQYRMRCMDDSSAMTRWSSESLHGCLFKASSAPDDLVLQWNKQTGVCSIFHFQHVCRMMQASGADPAGAGAGGQAEQCSVYRASALSSCSASLNAHFVGVWLAGGSNRLTNLVCQSDAAASYRLETVNVQWTEEGAQFDGRSTYALLNDSRFVSSDPSASFTWLMRLKREPRVQPFIDTFPCNDITKFGMHLWEYSTPNTMYFNKAGPASDIINFLFFSSPSQLPSSPDSWIDIGISVQSGAAVSSFFYFNGSFVKSEVTGRQDCSVFTCLKASIGHRFKGSWNPLKGVLRAFAIANSSMTEREIREFFSSVA